MSSISPVLIQYLLCLSIYHMHLLCPVSPYLIFTVSCFSISHIYCVLFLNISYLLCPVSQYLKLTVSCFSISQIFCVLFLPISFTVFCLILSFVLQLFPGLLLSLLLFTPILHVTHSPTPFTFSCNSTVSYPPTLYCVLFPPPFPTLYCARPPPFY